MTQVILVPLTMTSEVSRYIAHKETLCDVLYSISQLLGPKSNPCYCGLLGGVDGL